MHSLWGGGNTGSRCCCPCSSVRCRQTGKEGSIGAPWDEAALWTLHHGRDRGWCSRRRGVVRALAVQSSIMRWGEVVLMCGHTSRSRCGTSGGCCCVPKIIKIHKLLNRRCKHVVLMMVMIMVGIWGNQSLVLPLFFLLVTLVLDGTSCKGKPCRNWFQEYKITNSFLKTASKNSTFKTIHFYLKLNVVIQASKRMRQDFLKKKNFIVKHGSVQRVKSETTTHISPSCFCREHARIITLTCGWRVKGERKKSEKKLFKLSIFHTHASRRNIARSIHYYLFVHT